MLCILIVSLHFANGYIFVHQSDYDILWMSDCTTVESPSASICALICMKNEMCLNFAYNKTETLCKFNCKVYWSLTKTSEGQAYYERKSENLALLKPANSSTAVVNYAPDFAVDGVLPPKKFADDSFHSLAEVSPWILVDLLTTSDIDYLKIYNRWDEYGERLRDIKIEIDDKDGTCDDFLGPAANAQVVIIPCQPTTRGRHVKVYIDGLPGEVNALTIPELEIRQFR